MKVNDIVFVFNAYDVLTRNVIDLLLEKDYNVAKINSCVTRINGTRTFYAFDIERKPDGMYVSYVVNDTSSFTDKDVLFFSRNDIFKILDKAANENHLLINIIKDLTCEINEYFKRNGLEVIVPVTRFDTYGGTEE